MKINGNPDGGDYPVIASITRNGEYVISIEVPSRSVPLGTLSVSSNGTYTPDPESTIKGWNTVSVNVQGGGGITEQEYTEKNVNITNLSNNAGYVAEGIFMNNYNIQTVSLPECTAVNSSAFSGCENLTDVYLPVCTVLSDCAFQNCYNLSSIYIPECQHIYDSVFAYCTNLSYISLPVCSYIENYGFAGTQIVSASLPALEKTKACTFYGNGSLTEIYAPNLYQIGSYCFQECTNLSSITTSKVSNLSQGAFLNCRALSSIDIPLVSEIHGETFLGCQGLYTLNLYNQNAGYELCSLQADPENIFYETPLYALDPSAKIIVNNGLLSQYMSAEGWSYFYSIFSGSGPDTKPLYWDSENSGLAGTTGHLYYNWSEYVTPEGPINTVILPNCSDLQTYFTDNTDLTYVSMPVSSIYGGTFTGCVNLSSITTSQLTSIGGGAFSGCSKITELSIADGCFAGGVQEYTFYNCRNLSVSIPGPINYVGTQAFCYCFNIPEINLDECTYIGSDALHGCSALTSLNLQNVTVIDQGGLYGCTGITSLELPVCTMLGHGAFHDCMNLSYISIPNVYELDSNTFMNCQSLESIDLQNLTWLSSRCFQSCYAMSQVNMPNCSYIGSEAFRYCSALGSFVDSNIRSIHNLAFAGCDALSSVVLGNDVDFIGAGAFSGCSNLTYVQIENVGALPDIDSTAFTGCEDFKIYVMIPDEWKEAFPQWSSRIFGLA